MQKTTSSGPDIPCWEMDVMPALFTYNKPTYTPIVVPFDQMFNHNILPRSMRTKTYPDIFLTNKDWRQIGLDECPIANPYICWPLPIIEESAWCYSGPATRANTIRIKNNIKTHGGICRMTPMAIARQYFFFAKRILHDCFRRNCPHNEKLFDRSLCHVFFHIFYRGIFTRRYPAMELTYESSDGSDDGMSQSIDSTFRRHDDSAPVSPRDMQRFPAISGLEIV